MYNSYRSRGTETDIWGLLLIQMFPSYLIYASLYDRSHQSHMCISNLSYAIANDLEAFPIMTEIHCYPSFLCLVSKMCTINIVKLAVGKFEYPHSYDLLEEDINAEKL